MAYTVTKAKLDNLLFRLKKENFKFIEVNDYAGFYKQSWKIIFETFPDMRADHRESKIIGFKQNDVVEQLAHFSTVKDRLNKIMEIGFDAMRINTENGYNDAVKMILEMVGHNGEE